MMPPPPINSMPAVGEIVVLKEAVSFSVVREEGPRTYEPPHVEFPEGTKVRVIKTQSAMIDVITLDEKYATVLLEGDFRRVPPLEWLAEQAE